MNGNYKLERPYEYYTVIRQGNETDPKKVIFVKVDAEPLAISEIQGFDLFAHRTVMDAQNRTPIVGTQAQISLNPIYDVSGWTVSEGVTGTQIGKGNNKDEAVNAAKAHLITIVGLKRAKGWISVFVHDQGISPRYKEIK